jgi:hypothetical protein
VSIVLWHWIVSIAPGVAAWACLTEWGYLLGSDAAQSALVGARAAALLIVSLLAWVIGFRSARGAAGVAWLAAMLALLVRRIDLVPPALNVDNPYLAMLTHAVAVVFCPFLLIGNHPSVAPGAICAALVISTALFLMVLRLSISSDLHLVEGA